MTGSGISDVRRPRLLDLFCEIAQAIPPAYTQHIGLYLKVELQARVAA